MKLDLVKNTISWEVDGEEISKGIQLYNILNLLTTSLKNQYCYSDIEK